MDFRVIISRRAVRDLAAITKFIAKENPGAALKLGERLISGSFELEPFSFAASDISGARKNPKDARATLSHLLCA